MVTLVLDFFKPLLPKFSSYLASWTKAIRGGFIPVRWNFKHICVSHRNTGTVGTWEIITFFRTFLLLMSYFDN